MAEEEPGTAAEMSSPMCETAGPENSLLLSRSVVDPDPGSGAFLILDPDPGSGIWCLFDPGPGSGIRNSFFRDLGSRIPDPTPYFLELSDKFLGKKFYNSLKTSPIFFHQHLKNKITLNFVKFLATKKRFENEFFSPLSFVAVFGSGIRDPGSGMGKIRIRDPG
jgi:hypothetical protein